MFLNGSFYHLERTQNAGLKCDPQQRLMPDSGPNVALWELSD